MDRYEVDLDAKIGMGYFSDVYKAQWHGRTVAVKVLAPTTPSNLFVHEMAVWKSLPDHPNVLPLLGASSATGDPPWFFVSPYMRNGSLVDYLRKVDMERRGVGMEDKERRMVYEVAKGMQYLHKMGVMHGDFKVRSCCLSVGFFFRLMGKRCRARMSSLTTRSIV